MLETIVRTVEIPLQTAQELLTVVSPFGGALPRNCIYRGQSNANWQLIPSACRHGLGGINSELRADWSYQDQVEAEIGYWAKFVEACDEQGLPVPGDTRELRSELVEPSSWFSNQIGLGNFATWPSESAFRSLTLAQHHGVPTRLLDWTSNPFIACYFAAEGQVLRKPMSVSEEGSGVGFSSKHEEIAVWIFNPAAVWDAQPHMCGPWMDAGIVTSAAPYFENPNLRAQQGVMTYVRAPLVHNVRFSVESLPHQASRMLDKCRLSTKPLFVKLTVPASEAASLLVIVRSLGYSASTLFPGYGGTARQVRIDLTDEYKQTGYLADIKPTIQASWVEQVRRAIDITFEPLTTAE